MLKKFSQLFHYFRADNLYMLIKTNNVYIKFLNSSTFDALCRFFFIVVSETIEEINKFNNFQTFSQKKLNFIMKKQVEDLIINTKLRKSLNIFLIKKNRI